MRMLIQIKGDSFFTWDFLNNTKVLISAFNKLTIFFSVFHKRHFSKPRIPPKALSHIKKFNIDPTSSLYIPLHHLPHSPAQRNNTGRVTREARVGAGEKGKLRSIQRWGCWQHSWARSQPKGTSAGKPSVKSAKQRFTISTSAWMLYTPQHAHNLSATHWNRCFKSLKKHTL